MIESHLFSMVNAAEAPLYCYGYLTNTIGDLKDALKRKKTTLKVIYTRLEAVLDESNERRFSTKNGNFAIFYYMDSFPEEKRY